MVLHSPLISIFTLCPNKDKCFNPWISMLSVCFDLNLLGFLVTGHHRFDCQFSVDLCNCFTALVIIRSLLSPNSRSQLLSFPCLSGWSTDSCTLECAWVFTRAHCAAAKTRDGRKKQWEGWPQWRGGYVYLYTKWCMCRPRTTQLDPVSVNTDTPPSDTHEHSRGGNWLAPDTFFSLSLLLFSSSLLPLLSRDLLHSSGWAFLKLQVWSSLVTKEEDEDRDVCGGALCVLCVCDLSSSISYYVCGLAGVI